MPSPPSSATSSISVRLADALARTRDALRAAGLESPEADARILLEEAAGLTRVETLRDPGRELDIAVLTRLHAWTVERCGGMPVQYITGIADFYGRRFRVTPDVLIPRPETELVTERALALWDDPARRDAPAIDLCTGSGAIAATLALERPGRRVVATDLSHVALLVARRNAQELETTHVTFHEGDLFAALPAGLPPAGVLVSNPPYVERGVIPTLPFDVREHEPHLALDGGEDGCDVIRRILAGAPAHLRPGAALVLEIGDTQGETVLELARAASYYSDARVLPDLAGRPRILTATLR